MNKKLLIEGLTKIVAGLLLLSLFIFLPAGTLSFPNGYLFLAVLFIPMTIAGILMLFKSPELLKERLNVEENDPKQKLVVKLSGLMFLLGFVFSGLSFRFSAGRIPFYFSEIFSVIFLIGYAMYFEVLRENAYLSRTIKTEENQKVIDTGLYGVIRHPMYTATIIMFLSMPVILGSWIALLVFLLYPVLIIIRLSNEEKLLENHLKGYAEYKTRVRYRLIPFVW